MKIFVDLDYKKNPICETKRILVRHAGVIPTSFRLVKEFVNLHCNQVNAVKRISFASFDITKGKN